MSGPVERKATTRQLWTALIVMLITLVGVIAIAVYWIAIRPQSERADASDAQAQVVASQAQTLQSALATAASACASADPRDPLCRTLSSLATQTLAVTPTTTHGGVETVLVPVTEVTVRTQTSVATVQSGYPVYTTRTYTVLMPTVSTLVRTIGPAPVTTVYTIELIPATATAVVTETEHRVNTETVPVPVTATVTATETPATQTQTQTLPPATVTETATETTTTVTTTTGTVTVTQPPATVTATTTITVTVTPTIELPTLPTEH